MTDSFYLNGRLVQLGLSLQELHVLSRQPCLAAPSAHGSDLTYYVVTRLTALSHSLVVDSNCGATGLWSAVHDEPWHH